MKIVATIGTAFLVLVAAIFFLGCSLCAISGDIGYNAVGRGISAILATISLAVMIGGIVLIARINRKERPATHVTPKESVTPTESQPGKRS